MTRTDVLKLIESEQERTMHALTGADPLSERYRIGISNFSSLVYAADAFKMRDGSRVPDFLPDCAPDRDREAERPTESMNEDRAEPAAAEEKPETEEKPQPKYTKAQVRKLLGDAQLEHPELNLPELIRSFGAAQLSEIPAERYPKLIERLGELITPASEQSV